MTVNTAPSILVIEDDPKLLRTLRITLEARKYRVAVAATGAEGLRMAAQAPPDLVVLDLGLPDVDGVDVICKLRAWSTIPILVLSGRGDSSDKVEALDMGADDYLTKPFGVDELLARLRALTRRSGSVEDRPTTTMGAIEIDLAAHRVSRQGQDIRLTPTEWRLLEVLVRNPGVLLSQRRLLREAWGPGYEKAQGNLRLYMVQLRRKLEEDPARPRHLLNEPGLGYRFAP